MLQLLVVFVLPFFGLFVDFEETVELEHRSGHAEPECFLRGLGIDIHRGLVEHRGHDLRGHKTLPDQLVNLEFIFF